MPDLFSILFKILLVVLVVLTSIKAVLTILDIVWKSVFNKDTFFTPTMKADDRFLVELGKMYNIRFRIWDIDDGKPKFAAFARTPGSLDVLTLKHGMAEQGQMFFRGRTKAEAQEALKAFIQDGRTFVQTYSVANQHVVATIPKCSSIEELRMKSELDGKEV